MGMFYSYCKGCNKILNWFLKPKYGFIQCKKCDEYNAYDDLLKSLNNENYWKVLQRIDKLKRIQYKINENCTNN
jgi:hypothetical protein